MELFETRDFLWPPPPSVLTRAREVIFIETPLILPPSPHLIPNTTNTGMSADSGLFDGWGREATLDAIVLINVGLGWGCYSGVAGCQWVHNIFKKLQTWSINKNINPQHTLYFGQVPRRALQLLLTSTVLKSFQAELKALWLFHIFSWVIHRLCLHLKHFLTHFVKATLGGSPFWRGCQLDRLLYSD